MKIFFAAITLMVLPLLSFSEGKGKRSFDMVRITGQAPTIDGMLTDPTWEQGKWEGDFVQFLPNENASPSQQTDFKILHDDNFIYVAIRCWDKQPNSIVNILSRRDDARGDRVGVEIDSYNDHITSYCFYVSSAGVKWDYTSSDLNSDDNNWNPIWWVKTSKDDKGWYAEMKIPLSELRFKPAANSEWGLEVGRRIYRSQEVNLWQPMSREQQGWNANLGRLAWREELNNKLPLSVTPYAVAQLDKFKSVPEDPFRKSGKDSKFNAGFDAKIGISNNWTTDVTVNPDFGQVDADPSQLNLSAYEIFQQERRPFFVEGRNIFSFGLGVGDGDLGSETLFYTRRIGRRPQYYPDLQEGEYMKRPEFTSIIGAAKISGRSQKGLSVGVMEAVTAQEFARISNGTSEHEVEIEPLTNYAVARVNQELNNAKTQFGAILTSTIRNINASQLDFLHSSATTGGVNFLQYLWGKKWSINFNTYFSYVEGSKESIRLTQESAGHYFQRPDAHHLGVDSSRTSLLGNGGKLILGKESGRLRMLLCVLWKSPQLDVNDLGFVRSYNDITNIYWAGYSFNKPKGIMRSANINFNTWNNWTYGGEFKGVGGNVNGHITFKNLWSSGMGFNADLMQRSTDLLRGGPSVKMGSYANWWGYVDSDMSKKLSGEVMANFGGNISNSSDRFYSLNPEVSYRPSAYVNFSVSPSYSFEDNALQYITDVTLGDAKQYILGRIKQQVYSLSLRLNVNITPELTLQYWGQPFVAKGDYSELKRAADVGSSRYSDRFHTFTPSEVSYDAANEVYDISEPGVGAFRLGNPNFTTTAFLSNMVLRWEYSPGSTLFVVWSQNRDSYTSSAKGRLGRNLDDLFGTFPYNIFLVKLSYRVGR